jgi:hypothetical protein
MCDTQDRWPFKAYETFKFFSEAGQSVTDFRAPVGSTTDGGVIFSVWFLFVVFLLLWGGLLNWRWRRIKRLAEAEPNP